MVDAVTNSAAESQLLSPLPWQQSLWARLLDQHQQNRLPHALLICAAAGMGKEQLAIALGQYLLCQQPENGQACGHCKSCLLSDQGTHPDLVRIAPDDVGKPIKVDQIRALVETITRSAQQGGYRVVVLGPAEEMNVNAANALLKVLEEPGDQTLFALYSHRPGRVMATIRSRCQSLSLPVPDTDAACDWLRQQAGFDGEPLEQLRLAGGAPMAALAQALEGQDEQRKTLYQTLKLIATQQLGPTQGSEKLAKLSLAAVLDWWLALVQDTLRYRLTDDADGINTLTAQKLIIGLSRRVNEQQMFEFADRIQQYRVNLMSRNNPNERLLLEDLLIRWGNLTNRR
ncbi:DNA polymerase III subunit delta' [Motiliproteus coralliicola]|uniref:DNA polymerase III subunit delta' n=1 Tax=Motiliproteus coralliicola TaxID=2283196 RepID=A0A369WYX7_9GAMM|nr:DNA polymerase III subunit delta' [Motiliproteus coralliicola]RDE24715.1 DNA polymerase III subunit delta' [Motiliproteus coralliicola]